MTTLAAQLVNADDGVVVRVMSFNVRTNYAPEDKLADCTNWDALRKENAASQIRTVAPDFVGTQETSDAQKAFFDGALAGTYAAIGKSGGSLNGNADEINAIYYKTSDWKNLGDGMFWFVSALHVATAGCWKHGEFIDHQLGSYANVCFVCRDQIQTHRRQHGT
jgi:hypothetical protein